MIKLRHLLVFIIATIILWTLSSLASINTTTNVISYTSDRKGEINLNELYTLGSCLLEEAGKRIVEIRLKIDNTDYNLKQDNSPVTQADIESHKIIMHTLQFKYPMLSIVSEEDGQLESEDIPNARQMLELCDTHRPTMTDAYFSYKDLDVWIDPLDATKEYSENLTDYVTVMFCVAIKGEPRVGIIHKPFSKNSVKSFLETQPFREFKPPVSNRLTYSRSHNDWFPAFIKKHLAFNTTLIPAGGSGYKTMLLLENKADVYLHKTTIKKWDICAPDAIITNLGGKLLTKSGMRVDYSDSKEPKTQGLVAALENFSFFWDTFKF